MITSHYASVRKTDFASLGLSDPVCMQAHGPEACVGLVLALIFSIPKSAGAGL